MPKENQKLEISDEEVARLENELKEKQTPKASVVTAIPTDASTLVEDDTDNPTADNKEPEKPEEPRQIPSIPTSGTDTTKKRGRPKLTDEEKAARKAERQNRPPPSFGDLPKSGGSGIYAAPKSRDYQAEAVSLFVPVSMALEKALGKHWGIAIDQEKKTVALSEEQQRFILQMAQWLEYEQFSPMSPRWGMAFVTAAYALPRLKTEPTPERLKIAWLKLSGIFKRVFKRKET
jgi:hypothetical protein